MTLSALPAGTYKLIETKAPAGYNLANAVIQFTISCGNDGKAMRLTWNDNENKVVYPNQSFEDADTTITVINSKGVVLPETGGSGTIIYTLGGFAVIAVSLMYGLSMRRKKEKGGCH